MSPDGDGVVMSTRRKIALRKKAWAVTSGSYSDYGIEAVFESREDAEAAKAEGFGDAVEEFEFYASGKKPVFYPVFNIHVDVSPTGQIINYREADDSKVRERRVFAREAPEDDGKVRVSVAVYEQAGGRVVTIFVEGRDRNRVAQTFSDRLATVRHALSNDEPLPLTRGIEEN
jgi:hypothetical protein